MDDAQSGISTAASSVFEGLDAPHLQGLREQRNECKAALNDLTIKYAEYAARDPQEWEAIDADLDLFEEVQDLDSRSITICVAFKRWVARCTHES